MKKRSRLVLLVVLATFCMAFLLAGCHPFNYELYFRVDGNVYATIITSGDEVISIPDDPVKDGYTFDGWYWDNNVWEKPFTVNSLLDAPISRNMSVYAKFTVLHDHEPAQNWSYDAETHWKDCSCGEQLEVGAHVWSQWSVEKPATEEETGLEVRTCTVCGQREQHPLSQLPHTHSYTNENPKEQYLKTPADCYGGAVYYKSCSCGDKGTETFTCGDPVHQYIDTVYQPTCDSDGYTYHECGICGDNYSDNHVDRLEHVAEYHGMKSPTCLESGNSEYWSCSLCHNLFSNRECTESLSEIPTIEATGHSYDSDWDHDKNYHWKNATCEHSEEKGFMALHDYDETYTCRTCGYEDTGVHGTDVLPTTLHKEGETLSLIVANAVTIYSLRNEFTVADGAVILLSSNVECTQPIASMTVSLNEGDNVFYLLVTKGDDFCLYTITIRRRPMYTVSFDTDSGKTVPEQRVEEGLLAEEPSAEKTGYHFEGWDYNFSTPVTGDVTVKANWSPNQNTKYTVKYYLENLEDNEFTLRESVICYGETDSTVKAEIRTYDHFTVREDNVEGTVAPDGTAVLKVYYKRDVYTVTFEGGGGTRTGGGEESQQVKYLGSATPPVYTYRGYNFIGFNGSCTNISASVTLTAQWSEIAKQNYDMSNVRFTDIAVTYDGQEHSIYITFTQGGLPEGVSVRYENNGQTDVGEYLVTAIFTGNAETHNPIPVITAKLTIRKAKINMSNVIFESQTVIYDGELHSLTVQNLPKELNEEDITYYYNGQEGTGVSEPGEYTVIVAFREFHNYENIENLRATLKIDRVTYEEKYEQYSVLGKTIDLIHADSITSTVAGGKSVFSDALMGINIYRQDLGKQEGVSSSSSDISEVMEKFSASIDAKVSFGSRKNKNGSFLTNMLPSLSVSGSGSYQKVKKSKTNTYSYMYNYLMDGYRVDIDGYRDPSKFTRIISEELISDAEKIRKGALSPDRFIQMWGTHVIMSAIYGEKVDVTYTAISNDFKNSKEWKEKLEVEFEKRFLKTGLDISASESVSSLKTESTSSQIQKLQINVTSKNVLAATSLDQFVSAYPKWQEGDHSQYSVFTDVPDESLYCIWYLLGDEYRDVIDILDDYMYSQYSELYDSRLSAIYSFMLADDFEFDRDAQTLSLNLQSYQESGNSSNFEATNFNSSTGVLSVYPAINGTSVKKIILNGSYHLDNSSGQQITKLIDKFSLEFKNGSWGDTLEIVLNNVGFAAGNNLSAFDFSEISNDFNVTLTVNGTNEICAGSGESAGNAMKGERINLCIVSFDPTDKITLTGGNGNDGSSYSESGSAGGAAILINNLTLNIKGTLIATGGKGGNGQSGVSYNVNSYNKNSQNNGGAGGSGGSGGAAVKADSFSIESALAVTLTGGVGGNGNNGGNGEGSNLPGNATAGHGGIGGAGGNGGSAVELRSFIWNNCGLTLTLIAGAGGNGGVGGNGGNPYGGNNRDNAGNGGQGGNGGNSGYCINAEQNITSTARDCVVMICSNGGNGGAGGNGGNGKKFGTDNSNNGSGGNGGRGGDSFIVKHCPAYADAKITYACGGNGGNGGDYGSGGNKDTGASGVDGIGGSIVANDTVIATGIEHKSLPNIVDSNYFQALMEYLQNQKLGTAGGSM